MHTLIWNNDKKTPKDESDKIFVYDCTDKPQQ